MEKKSFQLQRGDFDNFFDILPSSLRNSEKLVSLLTNVLMEITIEKLKELLRIFEITKQYFKSNTEKRKLIFCTCFSLDCTQT